MTSFWSWMIVLAIGAVSFGFAGFWTWLDSRPRYRRRGNV